MNLIKKIISFILPWSLRRRYLNTFFGYQIQSGAYIGLAWIFPGKLEMRKGSRIDHLTVAIHLDRLVLMENAHIGRGNWITGLSVTNKVHFQHQSDRKAELIMDENTSITKGHHIDCSNQITIGAYSTIAGYQSQLLTHSIDISENRQDSAAIHIGKYCFVGTNVVILGGTKLPDYSVLAAKSLLSKSYEGNYFLYAGVPAKPIKELVKTSKYFNRTDWFVY